MRLRRITTVCAAAALALLAPAPAQAGDTSCKPWTERVVASDLGVLENLEFDGRGGLLLSANTRKAILRLRPDGSVETVVPDVDAPGGQRVRGRDLFFNTGDSLQSGLSGARDGTIQRLNLDTGERTTYASGLTMPNGLVFLPNGDAVVSRDLGTGTRLTRIPASDPSRVEFNWAGLEDHNGLAVDTTGTFLYADQTFTDDSAIWRIRIDRPADIQRVARLAEGSPKGLDDMTIDDRNLLYVTAQGPGTLIRVNPLTGEQCDIATGLMNPSSVKFGRGPGWSAQSLYVTGFDGRVRELTPPAGYRAPDARPPIELRASPSRVRAKQRTRVTFTAVAFGDRLPGAVVRFAGRRVRTNARGQVTVKVRLFKRGRRFASVTRDGFTRTVVSIRVR